MEKLRMVALIIIGVAVSIVALVGVAVSSTAKPETIRVSEPVKEEVFVGFNRGDIVHVMHGTLGGIDEKNWGRVNDLFRIKDDIGAGRMVDIGLACIIEPEYELMVIGYGVSGTVLLNEVRIMTGPFFGESYFVPTSSLVKR